MTDIHDNAALYAADALSDSERSAFEAHLSTCPRCRDEVDEFRDVTEQLSWATATDPPESLRRSVLDAVSAIPQEGSEPVDGELPSRARSPLKAVASMPPEPAVASRRRGSRIPYLIAAAAVAAAIALGGWGLHRGDQADTAQSRVSELTSLLAAHDVTTVSGTVTSGGSATVVLSRSQGRALFVASDLPTLPTGKVYELWVVKNGAAPAGTFSAGQSAALLALPSSATAARQVAMTVEPAGGTQHPTTTPVFAVSLPRA